MRDLKQSDQNTLVIKDAVSGSDIELRYRMPSTTERIAYQNRLVKRKGGKIQLFALEARIEFGLKILTGFREGDFGFDGKPISSDPKSNNYREDWKELIRTTAADIINAFAFVIFEGASVNADLEINAGEAGEEPPLALTSVQN